MAKYEVYPDPDGTGYLLDVQSDLLEDLNTRVVVPLILTVEAPDPTRRLNPVFTIEGTEVIMMTHFLASVPRTVLRDPVEKLLGDFAEITNALDMVFQGF